MEEHINQGIKLAERLLELMPENLGLDRDYLNKQFSGEKEGPSVGTKVAKYLQHPLLELVNGLRAHTGASGIILLLQDDQIPGLQVLKDGEWVDIITAPYSEGKSIICINTRDQIEVMSNGRHKRTLHLVLTNKEGSMLSIATFYNPAADALISPAPDLLYPSHFRFQDYLDLYATIKFADKGPGFQTMKKMSLSGPSLHV